MSWIEIIHKCKTPNLQEIERVEAQVGSIWECPGRSITDRDVLGSPCGDRWRLRQIKAEGRGNVGDFPKWDRLSVNGEPVPTATRTPAFPIPQRD